jgi:HK97 family phage major capsid protein
MSMTAAETRQEIKNRYTTLEEIERRYPQGLITNAEDLAQETRLLEEVDTLEANLATMEDAEQRKARILDGLAKYSRPAVTLQHGQQRGEQEGSKQQQSPGDQFINSNEYKAIKQSGRLNSLQRVEFSVSLQQGTSLLEWKSLAPKLESIEHKALLRVTGASPTAPIVFPDVRPGILELLPRQFSLLDLIPRLPTESDTVEIVQQTSRNNSAAFTAEATATTGTTGRKPESALAYAPVTFPVKTLATWIPVTNRLLADAPAIRGVVNTQLLQMLDEVLEDQMLNGNGVGENVTGLLNTVGILTSGLAGASAIDAILRARAAIRTASHTRPNAVVLNPADFVTIRLTRQSAATATQGGYLMGDPTNVGMPTLWSMAVIESEIVPAGTALVGDFVMGATLFDREEAAVRVGMIDDQFVRNMQTILAELRVAFAVWRPNAFARITGVA